MSNMWANSAAAPNSPPIPSTALTQPTTNLPLGLPMHVRILDVIREAGLPLGGPVPGELELAEQLGVARPRVREGLRVLEAFGAIDGRQGARRIWRGFDGGTFGEQIGGLLGAGGSKLLADFLEIRQSLETTLLPHAIDRLGRGNLAQIRSVALQMITLADRGEPFTEADEEFHHALFRGLDNQMLLGMMNAYWRVFHAYSAGRPVHEDRPGVARKHLAIVDAAVNGDIRLAVHELDAHFYGVKRRLTMIEEEAGTAAGG